MLKPLLQHFIIILNGFFLKPCNMSQVFTRLRVTQNALQFLFFFSSFSLPCQCFWTEWQKLFSNICPTAAVTRIGVNNMVCLQPIYVFNSCPLETNSNGGLKREHLEFSSLAVKNIYPLLQSLWPPNLAGW